MNRALTLAVCLPIVFVRLAWYFVTFPFRLLITYVWLKNMR